MTSNDDILGLVYLKFLRPWTKVFLLNGPLMLQGEWEPLPDVPARVPNTAPPREQGAGEVGGAARGGAAADPLASSYV